MFGAGEEDTRSRDALSVVNTWPANLPPGTTVTLCHTAVNSRTDGQALRVRPQC